jgi:gamma-glutamyl-gamma-aminobutyrate hydrolase PuuD
MNKPIIGIVTAVGPDPVSPEERDVFYAGKPYVDRVIEAGGVPLLLPHGVDPTDMVELIDGWLIIGGNDIDPTLYGQTLHPESKLEPTSRFELEKAIYGMAPPSLPVLGICYGCQFLNVLRGGDLIQHLPDVVGHRSHTGGTSQSYEVEPGSKTATALGTDKVEGKSYHHQAIGHLGNGLSVVAKSEDGVVEAVEDVGGKWIVGVQWHPERTPEDPASQSLFREFVAKASAHKESKTACGTW